jgi:O-antigen ligase
MTVSSLLPPPSSLGLWRHDQRPSEGLMAAILQIAVVAVVLAALPYKLFELDRFFVPKELVLHLAALGVAIPTVFRARRTNVDIADVLMAVFIAVSVLSALFATNYWLAQRALGVSVSSAVIFWSARRLGASGSHQPILRGVAVATVLAAATGVAHAYGFEPELFSQNRAPGGTFGNRNFVAHFVTIGLPALIYATVRARTSIGAAAGSLGVALVAALLVMSRTRAAWLAVATTAAVLAIPLIASRRYWGTTPVAGRLVRTAFTAAIAVGAAMFLPNRLNWRSDSPYLDSAIGVVDYSSGSGRGRVAQYTNSLRIVRANPVFGAGPGNWPVEYPRVAPGGDRSLNNEGMTDNPWPSSDWVAYVSERGVVAAIALLGVFTVLFLGALRRWSALYETDLVLSKLTLAGTITATMVVSAFDAVLLLGAPALLAWTVIGVTSGAGVVPSEGEVITTPKWWRPVLLVCLVLVVASLARSAAQLGAITSVANGAFRAGWYRAAILDPGSYRIALRAAELHASRGQCAAAREDARRARSLFPNASAPRRVLQRC